MPRPQRAAPPRPRAARRLLGGLVLLLCAGAAAGEVVGDAVDEAVGEVVADAVGATAGEAADEPAGEAWERFRVATERPGVYAVRFEELAAAGLAAGELPSSALALSNRGAPVAIWIDDGGDGRFGPGDRLEFVAERLPGTEAYYHEYSPWNVYWLALEPGGGARMVELPAAAPTAPTAPQPSPWRRTVHLERDRLLVRLGAEDLGGSVEPELWFWQKLTHVDREPLEVPLELPGLAAAGGATVSLAAGFRALSSQPDDARSALPDHQVDLALTSRRLEPATWDGKAEHVARPAAVAARHFEGAAPALALSVPRRKPEGSEDPLVDVVMLNWIEVDYPHDGGVGGEQVQLRAPSEGAGPAGPAGRAVGPVVVSLAGGELVAYGASGTRIALPEPAPGPRTIGGPPEPSHWLVPAGALYSVARIERDRPSTLRAPGRRADYLILAHATLLDEARRLADFHRERGLAVELVDVQDVYDEFGHGIVHPRAVKAFIAWAWEHWTPPRPRYVLLVGDASWDTKNAEAGEDPGSQDRNLIPTYDFPTREGHAASDNWFVAVGDDDVTPELAIGRFPLVTPEELRGVVDKTIRYAARPPVGPWRRRLLWITNEWEWLQDHSIAIDEELLPTGLAGGRIFPASDEATNEHHQAQLSQAFDDGQLLVHFAGHGGRFIWRTAPRNLGAKNPDLFTLEHVEALAPNDRLPVVFSVTCHSGPFDHPTADSIAETFLRLPDRGAIAVISAAWRTSAASVRLSRAMMLEFAKGGPIGDAFLRAKHRLDIDDLIATYNLFADPATPLALPAGKVDLKLEEAGPTRRLTGTLDTPTFHGNAIVELLDEKGTVLASEELTVDSHRWEVELPIQPAERWVRAYLWSEELGIDALGALELRSPEP